MRGTKLRGIGFRSVESFMESGIGKIVERLRKKPMKASPHNKGRPNMRLHNFLAAGQRSCIYRSRSGKRMLNIMFHQYDIMYPSRKVQRHVVNIHCNI